MTMARWNDFINTILCELIHLVLARKHRSNLTLVRLELNELGGITTHPYLIKLMIIQYMIKVLKFEDSNLQQLLFIVDDEY